MKRLSIVLKAILVLMLILSFSPITKVLAAVVLPPTYEDIFPDASFRAYVFPIIQAAYPEVLVTDYAIGEILADALGAISDLDVSDLGINSVSGIEWFTGLVTLDISGNNIAALPGINSAYLLWFDCSDNEIEALPPFPSGNIKYFNCSNNKIAALPDLPGDLEELYIAGNLITAFPALPPGLEVLDCRDNQIIALPTLPGTLNYLDCGGNQISAMPTFTCLTYLDCSDNDISELPMFPGSLLYLDCSGNSLIGLPYFPDGIEYIDCSDNALPALPYLFRLSSLMYLDVSDNLLSAIPSLPGTVAGWEDSVLEYFWSSGNLLGDGSGYLLIGNENPAGVWNQTGLPNSLLDHDLPAYVVFDPAGGARPSGTTIMWVILSDTGALPMIPGTDPVRPNFIFDGWYFNGAPVNVGDVFSSGDIITAKWLSPAAPVINYVVSFNTDGGSPVCDQIVESGYRAEKPADPIKDGYIFKGWYKGMSYASPYDFDADVIEDLILYAKWEANDIKQEIQNKPGAINVPAGSIVQGGSDKLLFSDVKKDDWYYEAIRYVFEKGLMAGISGEVFNPDASCERGLVVTVLYKLAGTPSTDGLSELFNDVSDDKYYAEALAWAASNRIVSGYGNGMFGPEDEITREQMVAITHNYCKWKGLDVSVGENTNILSFNDAFSVSEWAIPGFQWACGAGVIGGKPGGLLDPQGITTRAEFAAVLCRVIGLFE